jgi:hypothetical protein
MAYIGLLADITYQYWISETKNGRLR